MYRIAYTQQNKQRRDRQTRLATDLHTEGIATSAHQHQRLKELSCRMTELHVPAAYKHNPARRVKHQERVKISRRRPGKHARTSMHPSYEAVLC